MRWFVILSLLVLPVVTPVAARAEGDLGVKAPPDIVASGLLAHILPRFSLKTGQRTVADPGGSVEIASEPPGTPVFARGAAMYYLRPGPDPRAARLQDWLTSDIGLRTVASFVPADGVAFTGPPVEDAKAETPVFDGDAQRGEGLSYTLCGRCHVVGPANLMNGIGSTPSFAVLRALPDWDARFQAFYALRPHPAFTQVAEVTAPFDAARPSPIVPVDMTLDDLDAILAFVAAIPAADLGAPLHLQ